MEEKYKLLFPEFVSTLLHYINVISLSNLYTILNKNNIGKKESEIIDYEFKLDEEPSRDMLELNKELNLGLEDELLYVHAVEAYLNSIHGVSLWAMRKGFQEVGVKDNDFLVFPNMMDGNQLFL